MKNKVRIQKAFVLLFMVFAVFNYNNCELTSTSSNNSKVVPVGEVEDPILNDKPNDKIDVAETDLTGVTELSSEIKYELLLESYTDSELHKELITCGSCHKGSFSSGAHGDLDPENSLNDILTYYSSAFNQQGKVDFSDSENSVLYKKALEGHKGANADSILSNINLWINDYNTLIAGRLKDSIKEIPSTDNGDGDTSSGTIDLLGDGENDFSSLRSFSTEISLPVGTSTLSFHIDGIGQIDISIEYIATHGFYMLKNPTLRSQGDVFLKEMRFFINGEVQKRYGTWSSTEGVFSDGEILGSGTLFIEEENPGNDLIKIGFVDIRNE